MTESLGQVPPLPSTDIAPGGSGAKPPQHEMGILEHLGELRSRLMRSIIVVVVLSFASYSYAPFLFDWLSGPYRVAFPNAPLIGTGPAEAMTLKITVALFAAVIVALPYLFWQVWGFVAPGLYDNEKKMVVPFIIITTICFLFGVTFCYYAVLPISFAFFKAEYESVNLTPQIRMSEHLSLTMQALIAFGVIFEMPILSFLFARLGVLTYAMLLSGFRYVIVGIFIVSAVLTPPDVVSQILMAGPMLFLYGISLLVVKATERRVPKASPTDSK